MPTSTVLPAQAVEFTREVWYPKLDRTDVAVGTGLSANEFTRGKGGNIARNYNDPAGRAQVGSGEVLGVLKGRMCCLVTTAAATYGRGWQEGWWRPAFDPAGFNPGSFLDPDSVVMAVDFNVACTTAAFSAGLEDQTGFWFIPAESFPPNMIQSTPAGSFAQGGFGVALNDDGAGANLWEFVTYSNVGITSRVAVPVADVTDWNTFRFIVVSAASGRQAALTVQANGSTVVDGIPFDDVTLFRPSTLTQIRVGVDSPGWIFGMAMKDMGGDGFGYDMRYRQGRFTPSGTQVQGA